MKQILRFALRRKAWVWPLPAGIARGAAIDFPYLSASSVDPETAVSQWTYTTLRALAEYPLVSPLFTTVKRYERQLSAVAMVAGFIFDNYLFERVDHPVTQVVLIAYLVVAILSIVLVHFIEADAEPPYLLVKARPLFVVATQFALGGLWSAFLIFYGRSALTITSWPFLLVLATMLIANEVFRQYHARLAFNCTLLFLAMFSYAIFMVPVFTGTMGRATFLLSGVLAVTAFVLVLFILRTVGRERLLKAGHRIVLGAAGVFATINLFYFTNVLPPLPLALSQAGVFHSVVKDGDVYRAVAEPLQGLMWYGLALGGPEMHVERGGSLALYSAVFAPIQLTTNIVHVWQRYDEAARMWRTESTVRFRIVGGRDGGYRGYTTKSTPATGRWRVNIETSDGLLIGRVPFSVRQGSAEGRTMEIIK